MLIVQSSRIMREGLQYKSFLLLGKKIGTESPTPCFGDTPKYSYEL